MLQCLTYFLQIIKLKEDSESIQKCYKEELQKISSDLKDKSTSEVQLNLEVIFLFFYFIFFFHQMLELKNFLFFFCRCRN